MVPPTLLSSEQSKMLWFPEQGGKHVGRISPSGSITDILCLQ